MRRLLTLGIFGIALATGAAAPAYAHCDGEDGPVAAAALRAVEASNVHIALPYAPAAAEAEITRAYERAAIARTQGAEARAVADRHFMETVVRLHRAGEHAPFTGLQPAGTDHGAAIPAAERALASGETGPLVELLLAELRHGIAERLEQALRTARAGAAAEARTAELVPTVRERVSAEFAFVGYVEGIHQALKGAAPHAEAGPR